MEMFQNEKKTPIRRNNMIKCCLYDFSFNGFITT